MKTENDIKNKIKIYKDTIKETDNDFVKTTLKNVITELEWVLKD